MIDLKPHNNMLLWVTYSLDIWPEKVLCPCIFSCATTVKKADIQTEPLRF